MEQMQEEFERWAKKIPLANLNRHLSGYESEIIGAYWDVWQASRQALVVELPVTCCRTHVFEIPWTNEVGMEHDEYFEVEDIHKCLDAAGIKYK